MRAVEVAEFGGPEVLRAVEVQGVEPGRDEVVVDVAAAGVLSLDTLIRAGSGGDAFPDQPPYVPGRGVAGTVTAVGTGVDGGWVGKNVVADLRNGGYAERAIAHAGSLVAIPDGLGPQEAISLLHDGSTAVAVSERVGLRAGETVLAQPAAGGMGSILVQLARSEGARVIAAARGEDKLSLAKQLGADVVVDYSVPGWDDEVRAAAGGGVDVAITGVGGDLGRAAFELVRKGGRFSNYGVAGGGPTMIGPEEAAARGVRVHGMEQLAEVAGGRMARFERVLRMGADGLIRPIIGGVFALEHAAEAHAALERRAILGKALLMP